MKPYLVAITLWLAVHAVASTAASAQENPNAAVDEWRAAMAEWTMDRDQNLQRYQEDRALWQAQVEEMNRPLSTRAKILIALGYVGDKALTGLIDYHASRAAIRTEMKRFDGRFQAIRTDLGRQIVEGNVAMEARIASAEAALSEDHHSLDEQLVSIQASDERQLRDALQNILSGQDAIYQRIRPHLLLPCQRATPWGLRQNPEPCVTQ